MDLTGKVAVITGAGAGIGLAYAQALAARGAHVGLVDIDGDLAERKAREITETGARAIGCAADVSVETDVDKVVSHIADELGGIDVLINNVGLHMTEYNAPCTTFDRAKWKRLFAVNLEGPMFFASVCAPFMRQRGGGAIVNQSSTAGYLPIGAYGVSKAALNGLTQALASELGKDNIRVNGIAPGLINTEATVAGIPEARKQLVLEKQLIHHAGQVEDLIGVMLLLCSDEGALITGETIIVSGGGIRRV